MIEVALLGLVGLVGRGDDEGGVLLVLLDRGVVLHVLLELLVGDVGEEALAVVGGAATDQDEAEVDELLGRCRIA